jgi:hypothetical protein
MRKRFVLLSVLLILSWSTKGRADPALAETGLLSFGEFAVTTNTVQTIIIETDGDEIVDAGITQLLPGRNGVFQLTSFDPSIAVSASIADTVITGPAGATFDVTAFTFDPPLSSQTTDGSGNLTINIGATLSTRAGVSYGDGPYRGTYTLLVNY